jgi:hypothetical protein
VWDVAHRRCGAAARLLIVLSGVSGTHAADAYDILASLSIESIGQRLLKRGWGKA